VSARLCDATLGGVRAGVELPAYDRSEAKIGVVHLGPGAFFRAHQAFYFDALLKDDPRWAVSAVALRTPGVRDALAPQDGLYTLATLDEKPRWRVLGAVKELLVAAETPVRVLSRLAAPETRLVTLTVTEKGYALGADGTLDFDHPGIRADLEGRGAPRSAVGWLVEGLRMRRKAGLKPFTTLSCDNLSDNGGKLAGAVAAFAARRDPELARWIEGEARFPRTVVDSITPATDDALRARTAEAVGLEDAWPVQREAFTQWVVEDAFGPGAPDWASVGVEVAADVAGYERAKLRLLNGAHSSLAYLGLLRGHATVAEAMGDPALAGFVRTLTTEDIRPLLRPPAGLDLDAYIASVFVRFRNPAVRHELAQIAWDGSQKLPVRLVSSVRDAMDQGRPLCRLAYPVAAWMRFIRRRARAGEPPVDPLAEQLMAIGGACGDEASDVAAFLGLEQVFGRDLAHATPFVEALDAAYAGLVRMEAGAADPLKAAAESGLRRG
jgi:fructuronate reductase